MKRQKRKLLTLGSDFSSGESEDILSDILLVYICRGSGTDAITSCKEI